MSEHETEQSLPISLRRREDQGVVEFGVTSEGAFIPLAVYKLGQYDKFVQQAKDRAEQEQQSEQQG
jgi:hypothetical protein